MSADAVNAIFFAFSTKNRSALRARPRWLRLARDGLEGVRFLYPSRKRPSIRPYRSRKLSGKREPRCRRFYRAEQIWEAARPPHCEFSEQRGGTRANSVGKSPSRHAKLSKSRFTPWFPIR